METDYNKILEIPAKAILNKRLTKAFFLQNFDLSAAEKKFLNQEVENLTWLASLRPNTVNIPAQQIETQTFEEIQIIVCQLRVDVKEKSQKAVELVQKYLPYPVLLIVEDEHEFLFNSADKYINQNDIQKRTIKSYFSTPAINQLYKNDIVAELFKALKFSELDKSNLQTTYNSYVEALIRYKAAQHTGRFERKHHSRTSRDMEYLLEIEELEKTINVLVNRIQKESMINRKVELNVKLQQHRQQIEELKQNLSA
ncbi:DUF4391 domain-containing protein [Salinimicrobium sp. TH3]|uniref:DUF4391 domain-containing protein n=1 Tax=Salinimicrobium sp. TH3 TaxID=2997342 RepID=UPI0022758B2E|nr:DUF4391 domain-containing protein [Salinimicrobium sp. TH3]MCY2687575.1 DUF4391 domain-containing protein [Salinimicrobium sp. TH3]